MVASPEQVSKSVRHGVAHTYRSVMPAKKHHRILVWVVFFVITGVIVGQMLYPLDRAVPFARLGHDTVGWERESTLIERISGIFPKAQAEIRVGGISKKTIPLVQTGAQSNAETMTAQLTNYPFWQRFIPGSILWQHPMVASWAVTYNTTQLDEFARKAAAELSSEPVNAGLLIKDSTLIATPDYDGYRVRDRDIVRALTTGNLAFGEKVAVNLISERVRASKTAADFADVEKRARETIDLNITIRAADVTFSPDVATRTSWLRLGEDTTGKTVLSIDEGSIGSYVDGVILKQVGKPAGQTVVAIVNGREASRQEGDKGRSLDKAALVAQIRAYMIDRQGGPMLTATMTDLAPRIVYNTSYTASYEGLQAYISEKAKHGAWINIQQLDGDRWSLGADDHDSVVSGSTYKLYVALYLFKEMNEGKRDWGTPILDANTDTCFNRMTIASTNPCAEEWLRQFGRGTLNDYLYSKGFSTATTFTHPQATHTSAADLSRYMIGLENGSLVGGAQRDRLLYSLSHHPYRYGIPTGSKGQVWDKVGFVFNYVNDAAIVYHPRGKYVMTIMTQGQSYGAIAAMTREIEKLMYP